MTITESIRIMHAASDRYGVPYLLGFLEAYGLCGTREATQEMAEEYIRENGIGGAE